jgi:iron(III) transport system substrate-binding protein
MGIGRRVYATLAATAIALSAVAGCGGGGKPQASGSGAANASNTTLTLYNAQHDDLAKAMVDGFTKETGIKVKMRSGKDFELANQLVQEGDKSPADVFITENSPAMSLVGAKGGFSKVDADTLAQVPGEYSPSDGTWVGFAARATVLVYNPSKLPAAELPKSIMDLSTPAWKGKIGIAAAGADFQAIVSAVLATKGTEAGTEWLKGLKNNAKVYPGNGAILKAVNAGEIPAGVVYHYYWAKDRAESGANSKNVELHYFGNQDPGAFVSVSGAGVLKASKHQKEAQQLVKYLTGKAGQQILADSKALEYTVGSNVPANAKLKPLSELGAPKIDPAKLNGPQVTALMQQVGLL